MNRVENEQNSSRAEKAPRKEAAEISVVDLQRHFENYKGEKINAVNSETQAALQSPNKRFETAASIGYTSEQVQQFKQEQGIDKKLNQNRQQIESLGINARTRIEAVKTSEAKTETPSVKKEKIENQDEREKIKEQFQEKRGNILTNFLTSEVTSNGLDLVPFAGSGKMVAESIAGKTLAGKRLTGKERIIHGAMGAGSLTLDFIGIGEAKSVAIIAGKSVSLVEKIGAKLAAKGSIKSARIFFITAKFMTKHPQLTARAEQFAEVKIKEKIQDIKKYRKQATQR